jgi:hypothetical protein
MSGCADCFNCKIVGITTRRIGKYNYETLQVLCVHFHKNKRPRGLYSLSKNKTYENCPHFIGLEDE